jgi:hypothetical protein
MKNAYKISVGKPKSKSTLGRLGGRWEDNIRVNFRDIECEGVDCMQLAQVTDQWRKVVNTEMNLRFPQKAGILTS